MSLPNWHRGSTSAQKLTHVKLPVAKKMMKILLKFEFIVKELREGFGRFFFWPLAEQPPHPPHPSPHTPTETLSAVHYLLTDSRFESICILLLTGIHGDLHFTALGRGRGGRGGVVKMKHLFHSIWWKSFTCKPRGKWANRLGGVQT